MAVKVYISGISGNHEIRKQQQRVIFILSSLKIDFEIIDITEMDKDEDRNFMRAACKEHKKENALPPQIFNGTEYCGDYDDFEVATEDDKLMNFLKIGESCTSTAEITLKSGSENGSEASAKGTTVSNVETGESEAVEA